MNLLPKNRAYRLPLLLAVAALAVGVSGCGILQRTNQSGVSQDQLSAGGEPYFWAGPVTYQVQISRQLNAYDTADVQYLAGHSNPRTTQIYDRRRRRVTRNIVERISI